MTPPSRPGPRPGRPSDGRPPAGRPVEASAARGASRATPSRATPSRTTPARTTSARTTPAGSAPAAPPRRADPLRTDARRSGPGPARGRVSSPRTPGTAGSPPRLPAGRRPLRLAGPGGRLRGGLVVLLAVLALLGVRLVQLQLVSGTGYAEDAIDQRRVATPLPAARGSIVDRFGAPIAISAEGRAVSGQPRVIRDATCPPDARRPCTPATIAAALSPLLGIPAPELTEKLSRDTGFVYLSRDLGIEVGNAVRDLRLVGIRVDKEPQREHPGGELAANVVGFTNREGKGAGGIEVAFDSVLTGTDGRSVAQLDNRGRVIPSGEQRRTEPLPGRDVRLTLDRDLQWYAQDVLARKVAETEAASGSVVVIDVRTGEVLALADAPTFDADRPAAAPAGARGSRALSDMYDPGSVNKIITMAAAIEAGVVKPETVLTVPYSQQFGAKLVTDSHKHATEQYTVNGVFMQSSNVGTVQIAQKLGAERLTEAMRAFGFGSRTGLGLPGESPGLVPDAEDWSGSSLGTIPIGQGVSVTAVQIASVIQTVANGGVRIAPTIVAGTTDETGRLVPAARPETRRVISEATAAAMRPMLEGVVSAEGTAPLAAIPGYRIAGKTGTADRLVDGRYDGSYTSSFVGFAPADAPRIATVVMLQGTGKRDYYGGTVAGPVFSQVTGFALRNTGTPPTGVPFVAPKVFADGRK